MLRGTWDLPGPELEPMSPALAGGFLITAPPGKPSLRNLKCQHLGLDISKKKEGEKKKKASIPQDPSRLVGPTLTEGVTRPAILRLLPGETRQETIQTRALSTHKNGKYSMLRRCRNTCSHFSSTLYPSDVIARGLDQGGREGVERRPWPPG